MSLEPLDPLETVPSQQRSGAELPRGADPATVGHAQKTPAIEQLKRDVVLDGAVPPNPSFSENRDGFI